MNNSDMTQGEQPFREVKRAVNFVVDQSFLMVYYSAVLQSIIPQKGVLFNRYTVLVE